jgi:hypothetical protein
MAKSEKKGPANPEHKPRRREHRTGNFCGFHTDGESYWPAPTYTGPIDEIINERVAMNDLIHAVNSHAQTVFSRLRSRQTEIWKRMLEDIGLDRDLPWQYRDGRLWLEPKPEDKKAEGRS